MKPVLRSVAFSIIALLTFAAELSINAAGQASPDWITNKDRTGACQIAVPKNWGQSVTLFKGMGKLRTLSPETQKMYSQKLLENTERLVLYILKSAPTPGAKPSTTYQASVPGDGFHCTAQLIVQQGYSEDEVKKIVATFTATKP
jgi:hypothetical protein